MKYRGGGGEGGALLRTSAWLNNLPFIFISYKVNQARITKERANVWQSISEIFTSISLNMYVGRSLFVWQ